MRTVEKTYSVVTTATSFPWIHLDHWVSDPTVGIQCAVNVSASTDFSAVIEYTLADPIDVLNGVSAAGITLATINVSSDSQITTALSTPAGAVRLRVAGVSADGDAVLRVVQFGCH